MSPAGREESRGKGPEFWDAEEKHTEIIPFSCGTRGAEALLSSYFAEHSVSVCRWSLLHALLNQYVNGNPSHVAESLPAANVNWVF